jgi:hypothetical protein
MSKYIFTVTAGRSGQVSLTEIINKYSLNCHAEVEHPEIHTYFNGRMGLIEHSFRRKFIETNELLGRGKILTSFSNNNVSYIASIAKKKNIIFNGFLEGDLNIYFDVGKHFSRGLHIGFEEILKSYSVVLLVRDPMDNILSFLRRNKDFSRDNNHPSDAMNQFVYIKDSYTQVELYAWMWVETYLRFLSIIKSEKVNSHHIIHTEDLNKKEKIINLFEAIDIEGDFTDFNSVKMNTGIYNEASLSKKEKLQFLSFVSELPEKIVSQIPMLKKYT